MYTQDRSEEQVLVMRAQLGDRDAFCTLTERYQRKLYTVALRMTTTREDAEGIIGEVFLSAWRSLPNFPIDASFSARLCRMTLDGISALLQRREEERKDSGISVESQPVELKDRREILWTTVCSLSENHQSVLLLREIAGLNYSQIGEVLELTPATVKSRLSRIRRELRDRLLSRGGYFPPDLSKEPEEVKNDGLCEFFANLISDSLDGALTDEGQQELDGHLANCANCRTLWKQLSAVQVDLGEMESPASDFTERFLATVFQTEQEIPFTNLSQDRKPAALAREQMRGWWKPIRNWLIVLATVVVVLGVGTLLVRSGLFNRNSAEATAETITTEAEKSVAAADE